MTASTVEMILSIMVHGRRYNPRFIASRYNISESSVRTALKQLEYGCMIYSEKSVAKRKVRLYSSRQQNLQLPMAV